MPAAGNGGGGVVLGGKDVARGPPHFGPQGLQGFDQDGGLDGHVNAAENFGPLQGLAFPDTVRGWP